MFEDPAPGSTAWAARQLGPGDPSDTGVGSQLENGLAKYHAVRGDRQYNSLLTAAGGYAAFRIRTVQEQLVKALRPSTASSQNYFGKQPSKSAARAAASSSSFLRGGSAGWRSSLIELNVESCEC